MDAQKWFTLEEITDKHIGKKGTAAREEFDASVEAALIGASIKSARKACRLTQAELGERIGVQASQISKIESGRNLTLNTIIRVLKALNLSGRFEIENLGIAPVMLGAAN
ncbi:MAG: helix-turn-helix transcriptional regulator [Muribaculaceae bacterium]|nr:helix-turn-helix transcriptional regulator [Muribaculaceae bacterium]